MKNKRIKNLIILSIPFVLVTMSLSHYIYKREFIIYPSPLIMTVQAFSDITEGGYSISRLEEEASGAILWDYTLQGEELPFHFAGISFYLKNRKNINIRPYHALKIRISSSSSQRVSIQMLFNLEDISTIKNIFSRRFYRQWIPISSKMKTIRIPLNQFQTPLWWFHESGMKPDQKRIPGKMKKQLYKFEILSDEIMEKGVSDQVRIESISFVKLPIYFLSALIVSLLYYLTIFLFRQWQKKLQSSVPLHKELSVENYRDEQAIKILKFLSENYQKPYINLEMSANETGIPVKKISLLIKSATGLSFKRTLNAIRLEEAKRLLRETDRNITEIAYLVGYNNSSHFTRVFREFEKCSPKSWREQHS